MTDEIPRSDPDLERSATHSQELEGQLLESEAMLQKLVRSEVGQRYWIKWIAVVTGVVVILGMAFFLFHAIHEIFWGPFVFVSPALSVVIVAAPILSITSISVALFIGAFRKFEDKDLDTLGKGATDAARLLR